MMQDIPLPRGEILWEKAARQRPAGLPGAGIELVVPSPGTPKGAGGGTERLSLTT